MNSRTETPNLAAILLAAGSSTRLGLPKQLLQTSGESLVRRAARLLLALQPISLTVVTGYRAGDIEAELRDLPVTSAYNENWEQGMGNSIAVGAARASGDADGILIMLCDQWRLEEDDLFRLVSLWNSDISRIIVANWKEEKAFVYGPPALFPRNVFHELAALRGDRGARPLIERHWENVSFVELENAAFDVDRPEDLELIPGCEKPSPSN